MGEIRSSISWMWRQLWRSSRKSLTQYLHIKSEFGINFSKIEHLWPSSLKWMVSHYPSPSGRLLKSPNFVQVYWYQSCSSFLAHRAENWWCRGFLLRMHRINLRKKTDPHKNLIFNGVCFLVQKDLTHIKRATATLSFFTSVGRKWGASLISIDLDQVGCFRSLPDGLG